LLAFKETSATPSASLVLQELRFEELRFEELRFEELRFEERCFEERCLHIFTLKFVKYVSQTPTF